MSANELKQIIDITGITRNKDELELMARGHRDALWERVRVLK